MISLQNRQLQLNHAFQTETLKLSSGNTYSFKMGIDPDKSGEVLLLSQELDKKTNKYKFKLQKIMYTSGAR